ncbi:hypothetical protein BOTBODRAFT_131939 [Botryobasidium botryosum FD-172 SS1]|uniref:Uncharacterized protein n=1 Tax=Botryobasidium botryosum (strain FD-172 SS1) TaxID=930990 RepID=A0A067MHD9_BOTB1|nr:hypothetical protein BOTBODRAFT_131939 [Botryobasidium botryosum FD-172 SS1]
MHAMYREKWVKGFKIDEDKIAKLVSSDTDNTSTHRMTDLIFHVVHQLDRDAYQYIAGSAREPNPKPGQEPIPVLVIVLDQDNDEGALRKRELGPIDESIKIALPHALTGPGIWELRL